MFQQIVLLVQMPNGKSFGKDVGFVRARFNCMQVPPAKGCHSKGFLPEDTTMLLALYLEV
eukprot:364579-Chlamydomonas_euryale.AAC.8